LQRDSHIQASIGTARGRHISGQLNLETAYIHVVSEKLCKIVSIRTSSNFHQF